MRIKIVSCLLAIVFFTLGVLTLPHYGINWDTINHLPRGQAYLHYFLTGKKDYSDLPKFADWEKGEKWYYQNPKSLSIDSQERVPRRSLYQDDATPFWWFMEHDGQGHPPLSDILSSVFNLIFFQKLRLVNDIDAYRIYGVFLAAVLVGLVFYWGSSVYGNFAGFIAALSLAVYPLFWSESHFNTEKDVPETVFWGLMLFSIWRGITKKSWKWILVSGVFFGLALGTKFNILFSAFVILPWLVFHLDKLIKKNRKMLWAMLAAVFLGVAIFIVSWPYLWPDPIIRIYEILKFYKDIGLTKSTDSRFLGPLGVNTYALQWVIYTTPLVILFFSLIGLFAAISKLKKEKDKVSLLFLLWLVVPLGRVIWPGTSIYGGVRQIMEYIPAMALLSGLGAKRFIAGVANFSSRLKNRRINSAIPFLPILVVLMFLPITLKVIQIHPNENVYFNSLIGGLAGAKKVNFPAWGNSFGAPYRQGVNYLNENAENGANVVYAYELIPNIPRIWFRKDLNLSNAKRSGYLRQGEYAITLTHEGAEKRSYYDMYLEEFIRPVYQVAVDGVPILKIWKNDEAHLKKPVDEKQDLEVSFEVKDFGLRFDLGEVRELSRFEIEYQEERCRPLLSGYIQISQDGISWERLPGTLPDDWRIAVLGEQPKDGYFIEPFVGQKARFIDLVLSPQDTCLKKVKSFKVYYFLER